MLRVIGVQVKGRDRARLGQRHVGRRRAPARRRWVLDQRGRDLAVGVQGQQHRRLLRVRVGELQNLQLRNAEARVLLRVPPPVSAML